MSRMPSDTLFWPFASGVLPIPAHTQTVLCLNAVDSGDPAGGLRALAAQGASLDIVQFFKQDAAALEAAGYQVTAEIPDRAPGHAYDLALVYVTRQQAESRALIAQALSRLKPGGMLVCAGANDAGGRRLPQLYRDAGLDGQSESRNHAKVVWATGGGHDPDWVAAALADGALRPVEATGFYACPGLFSWDRVDPGSAMLVDHLPDDMTGRGADFGCGYGYLSRHLAGLPKVSALYCLDADSRALAACRLNLAGTPVPTTFDWADLRRTDGVPTALDWVVMNPPFHQGKDTRASIGQDFIRTAAQALKKGGCLYMVANAHLPYEPVLREMFTRFDKMREDAGYKIYCAVKAGS